MNTIEMTGLIVLGSMLFCSSVVLLFALCLGYVRYRRERKVEESSLDRGSDQV